MSATQSPSFSKLNAELKGAARETSKLKSDSTTAPRNTVQNVTVYHFYRGMEEFWMEGLMERPVWPDEYCKVGLLRATFKAAAKTTSEEGWKDDGAVVDTWPWIHYKNEDDGFRATAAGDVLVEDNGHAWMWEGSGFTFLGKFYNKAADPDPSDVAPGDAVDSDGEPVAETAPSMEVFEDGESALMAREREAEQAREAEIAAARAAAVEEAAAAAAAAEADAVERE